MLLHRKNGTISSSMSTELEPNPETSGCPRADFQPEVAPVLQAGRAPEAATARPDIGMDGENLGAGDLPPKVLDRTEPLPDDGSPNSGDPSFGKGKVKGSGHVTHPDYGIGEDPRDECEDSGSEIRDLEVDHDRLYRSPPYSKISMLKRNKDLGPKRMKQSREYLWLLELRVQDLEGVVRELNFKVTGEKSLEELEEQARLADEKRQREAARSRSIPELNFVKWEDFRFREPPKGAPPVDDSVRYTIDVLVGDPVIHFRTPNKGNRQESDTLPIASRNEDPANRLPTNTARLPTDIHNQLPERIRINSHALLRVIQKVNGEFTAEGSCLFFRPFRSLLYFEEELREWLRKLERKWETEAGHESKPEVQEIKPTNSKPSERADRPGEEEDEEYREITGTREVMGQLRCLLEFMDNALKPRIDFLKGNTCQKVYFSDMWHLFRPGDQVVSSTGRRQAYRVTQITGVRHNTNYVNMKNTGFPLWKAPPVVLHCQYLDCNGRILGPVSARIEIHSFEGEREIRSLPAYPIRFARETDTVQADLLARGKQFMELCKVKHVQFTGITLDTKEEVDSQVVVDFEQTLLHNPTWAPSIEPLPSGDLDDPEAAADNTSLCYIYGCCNKERHHNDFYVDVNRMKDFRQQNPGMSVYSRLLTSLSEGNGLRDDELLLLHHRVMVFILRSRKWGAKIDINGIREVAARNDKDGFDQLVLPEGHKDMVRSLVKQHFRERASRSAQEDEVDLVRGKGKGLIILLHGAPGVGKTSTAECVADSFNKPLFPITCGDLGTTATDVESRLETNFTLAHRWGCVLLLDEADIFLAERTKEDFLRNSLVSVFLRVLEYYAGILFLTTNRVGSFDEAFKSRIHISLYYPPLDEDSTSQVWRMNLIRTKHRKQNNPNFKMESKRILEYARKHFNSAPEARWNGRQIRNAFQTAIALAEFEALTEDDAPNPDARITLRRTHFETVAKASLHFDGYLRDLYGATQSKRALDSHARYDNYNYNATSEQWPQGREGAYYSGPARYRDQNFLAPEPVRRQPGYERDRLPRTHSQLSAAKGTGKKASRQYSTPLDNDGVDYELDDLELDDPELSDLSDGVEFPTGQGESDDLELKYTNRKAPRGDRAGKSRVTGKR